MAVAADPARAWHRAVRGDRIVFARHDRSMLVTGSTPL
jgi:hypothetical protein